MNRLPVLIVRVQGPVGVALIAYAVVVLAGWPWAVLLVGLAMLLDLGQRSYRGGTGVRR